MKKIVLFEKIHKKLVTGCKWRGGQRLEGSTLHICVCLILEL